jgi:peroxiredoxin
MLSARAPMPILSYLTLDGDSKSIDKTAGRPLLVSLWASWCPPCIEDLKGLVQHAEAVRSADVEILALCVDALDRSSEVSDGAARGVVERSAFPFAAGWASEEMLMKIDVLLSGLFDQRLPLAVPTSYLLDRDGNLAVLYRGSVNADQVLEDVARLDASNWQRRQWSVPFEGRWYTRPAEISLRQLALAFRGEYPDEERRYLERSVAQYDAQRKRSELPTDTRRRFEAEQLQSHLELAALLHRMGLAKEAITALRRAIELATVSGQEGAVRDMERQLENYEHSAAHQEDESREESR